MRHSISPKQRQHLALLKACRIVGSQITLARKLGIEPQRLNKWINRLSEPEKANKIPWEYAFAIEKLTQGQVTCEDLIDHPVSAFCPYRECHPHG